MDSVDISIKNLLQELSTAEEFENERLTFQVINCFKICLRSFM